MNQRELLDVMAELGASPAEARRLYQDLLGSLAEELARCGVASVPGIGTFSARVTRSPERHVVNPFTRQPMVFPARARARVLFAPAHDLLRAVEPGAPEPTAWGAADLAQVAFAVGLKRRGQIKLAGIGNFRVFKVPARRAMVVPSTGRTTPGVPSGRDVRFLPATRLREAALASSRDDEEA